MVGVGGPPGNEKRKTHGVYSVMHRGAEALPEALKGRELEVVENLATHEGVCQELERVALRYILICECGIHWLDEIVAAGVNPWRSGKNRSPEPVLRMLGSYLNGAARTLARLAELRGDANVIELDSAMTAAREVIDGDDSRPD